MTAKDFLQSILESLVENKAAINIQEKYDELGTLLSIEVDTSDMGAIIGKSGKTIDALRTVIRVFGSKRGERINIRLIEDRPIQ
ncbi:KH domain-containing protein [Candidatus Gracilibacteria bacterium]|nr:KH domain-containing protein [Candidatus Gracilibacteria bacterium]